MSPCAAARQDMVRRLLDRGILYPFVRPLGAARRGWLYASATRGQARQALRGIALCGGGPHVEHIAARGPWHWLSKLMFPLVRHLPGEERAKVRQGLPAIGGTGLEERAHPLAGIEPPHHDGLEHTKQHRGQVGTPDTARAII